MNPRPCKKFCTLLCSLVLIQWIRLQRMVSNLNFIGTYFYTNSLAHRLRIWNSASVVRTIIKYICYWWVLTVKLTVDAAVHEIDPHRRIAFVAAFAMSNYSSTIGRIAKPFNPMLVGNFQLSGHLVIFICTFLGRDIWILPYWQEVSLFVWTS